MSRRLSWLIPALVLALPAAAQAAAAGGYPSQQGQTGPAYTSGGHVQKDPSIVLVLWGWTGTPEEQSALAAERALVSRLGGTGYGAVLTQYGVHDDTRLLGVVYDSTPPPARPLDSGAYRHEVLRASRASGIPTSPDVQWTLLPATTADNSDCGSHGDFWQGGGHYVWTLTMPYYAPSVSDCAQGAPWQEAMTAATSHEWAEAATDTHDGWVLPLGPGWVQEIADVCAGQYVQPWGVSGPTVQTLWSNASEGARHDRGCVESAAGGMPRITGGARPAGDIGSGS